MIAIPAADDCEPPHVVSRVWRNVKSDREAWTRRDLANEGIVRLILDGSVVRVRLDRIVAGDVHRVTAGRWPSRPEPQPPQRRPILFRRHLCSEQMRVGYQVSGREAGRQMLRFRAASTEVTLNPRARKKSASTVGKSLRCSASSTAPTISPGKSSLVAISTPVFMCRATLMWMTLVSSYPSCRAIQFSPPSPIWHGQSR
jgi:hypothetical protein